MDSLVANENARRRWTGYSRSVAFTASLKTTI